MEKGNKSKRRQQMGDKVKKKITGQEGNQGEREGERGGEVELI